MPVGTHYRGPLLGDDRAWAGAAKELPLRSIGTQDWMVYENDFLVASDYDASNDWTLTTITAGTAAFVADSNTGLLRLDCPANQQGPILQLDGGSIAITPSASGASALASEAMIAWRLRLRDAGASSFFVGLAEDTSTSAVLTGAGAVTSDTHAGFAQADPDTSEAGAIQMTAAGNDDTAAATDAVSFSLADDEFVDLAVRIEGTSVARFYARRSGRVGSRDRQPKSWVHLGSLQTANAWDATMFPTVALAGSGTGDDLDVDKLVFAVRRDLTIG